MPIKKAQKKVAKKPTRRKVAKVVKKPTLKPVSRMDKFFEKLVTDAVANVAVVPETLLLSDNDPFERVLIDMTKTHRLKSQGYGTVTDPFQNFRDIAYNTGCTSRQACEALLNKHHAALKQWQIAGRSPNRTSDDAYLDRAVYAVIAKILYDEEVDIDDHN